jgi:hypothetical protein
MKQLRLPNGVILKKIVGATRLSEAQREKNAIVTSVIKF